MALEARKVRCREIGDADIDAVSDLLTRGFPGRRRDYWLRGLHRHGARELPEGCPRYGYLLESGGHPVGALLLLYAARRPGTEQILRCNVRPRPGAFQTSGFAQSDDRPLLSRLTARSVAVSDTLSLFNDRLLLTLGGRWQDIALSGFVTAAGPTQGTRSSYYNEARFSPAVGAVIRATDELSIYGNYIESLDSGPTAPATARNPNTVSCCGRSARPSGRALHG